MKRIIRLFRLATRQSDQDEVAEELRLHLELRAAELEAEGLSPEAARAEARRLFGDWAAYARQCDASDRRRRRGERRAERFDGLRQDWWFALRSAARRPLFAAVAVAVFALGIGANTAVFSLVNAVLLRPLPYDRPETLVMVRGSSPEGSFQLSENERLIYRAHRDVFQAIGAWALGSAMVVSADEPELIRAAYADADVLPVLGVRPALGRGFSAAEDQPGGDGVVMLAHEYWRHRFGGTSDALGRRIMVNGAPRVVIGVLPAEARLPDDFGETSAQIVVPLALDAPDPRNLHYLTAAARLAPEPGPDEASARLRALSSDVAARLPTLPHDFRIEVQPLTDAVLGAHRPSVLLLFFSVGLLLVLACANLAGLLLAGAEARRQEFAVRAALGAGRGRLTRQVLTESLVLGLVGGAAGIGVAAVALEVLPALASAGLPRADSIAMDGRVVAFAIAATIVTALGAGLIPALTARRTAAGVLRSRDAGGTRRHRARQVLVAGEVALALAIAVGAGLVVRSWIRLLGTDPGLVVERVLTLQATPPAREHPTRADRWRFYHRALEALRAVPGITAAGAVSSLPLDQEAGDWGFRIQGRPPAAADERNPYGDRFIASAGYFEAMGIPLAQGRRFTPADDADAPAVVMINQALARRYWPAGDALGARIRLSTDVDPVWREVIGVVGDVRSRGLDREPRPELFLPYAQYPASPEANAPLAMNVVARANGDPASLEAAARTAIRTVDAGTAVTRVRPLEALLSATLAARRFQLVLLSFFAVSGLALVALGVYGVVAFLAQQRTAEFGVRMALGADRRQILRLVLRDGAVLGGIGAAVGLAGALVGGRLLRGLLVGVSPLDPVVLIGIPALVLAVVLAAALSPALRAARTNPGITLRSD